MSEKEGHTFSHGCGPELLWEGWGKKPFTLVGTTYVGNCTHAVAVMQYEKGP